jgi:hypothetical protein
MLLLFKIQLSWRICGPVAPITHSSNNCTGAASQPSLDYFFGFHMLLLFKIQLSWRICGPVAPITHSSNHCTGAASQPSLDCVELQEILRSQRSAIIGMTPAIMLANQVTRHCCHPRDMIRVLSAPHAVTAIQGTPNSLLASAQNSLTVACVHRLIHIAFTQSGYMLLLLRIEYILQSSEHQQETIAAIWSEHRWEHCYSPLYSILLCASFLARYRCVEILLYRARSLRGYSGYFVMCGVLSMLSLSDTFE